MRIEIVYDNTSQRQDMKAAWGFSAYMKEHNLLFDTGGDGEILVENMKKMGIHPGEIKYVFISHPHWDHIGGLDKLMELNPDIVVYAPPSFGEDKNIIVVEEAGKIMSGIYSTGELNGIEQSMIVESNKGNILLVGCSHPGVDRIIETAKKFGSIYAIIGGFHDFKKFDALKGIELICPTHCTKYKEEIKSLYPRNYMEGGAGCVLEI